MRWRSGRSSRGARCASAAPFALACALAAWGTLAAHGAPAHAEEPSDAGFDPAAGAIRFYQGYLSSLRHGRCRFTPSCSQYALEAVRAHGVFEGSARAADRLMRCNRDARGFYARGAQNLLLDPLDANAPGRVEPRAPPWLLPSAGETPPPLATAGGDGSPARVVETVSFALSLAAEGDCYRAATEYRRAAHLAGTASFHAWAHLRTGACFFDHGEWALAESEFLAAGMVSPDDERRRAACLLAAASRYDTGDYDGSAALVADCDPDRAGSQGLLGLCDLARGRWADACARFERGARAAGDEPPGPALRFLAGRAEEGARLPHRDAALARAFSAVLPGSGQIYAGRVRDGLRHLVFNGALIYTIAKLAHDRHYPAAYLVAGLELPFYAGNVLGAGAGARSFDRAARLRFTAAAIADAGRLAGP